MCTDDEIVHWLKSTKKQSCWSGRSKSNWLYCMREILNVRGLMIEWDDGQKKEFKVKLIEINMVTHKHTFLSLHHFESWVYWERNVCPEMQIKKSFQSATCLETAVQTLPSKSHRHLESESDQQCHIRNWRLYWQRFLGHPPSLDTNEKGSPDDEIEARNLGYGFNQPKFQ